MIQILVEFLIKLLAWAAPFTLRKLYPPGRISDLIKVRISSEGDGVEFWDGDVPRASAWITITNLSPFPLELERAFGHFCFGAELEKFTHLQKEVIYPASEKEIRIEANLAAGHADIIRRLMNSERRAEVKFNGHIVCPVHSFDIYRKLGTTHYRLVNFRAAG